MDLIKTSVLAVMALIVIMYLSTPLITAINAANLTAVAGEDLTWVLVIISIIFFVGIAIAVYRQMT